MSDGAALLLTNLSGAAGGVWLGTMLWRTSRENLARREAWTRHKLCGTIMAYIAFIVCVPYAKVVSPDFLIPLLWPLALIMPIVCGWFVDYPTARGVGVSIPFNPTSLTSFFLLSYFGIAYPLIYPQPIGIVRLITASL